MSIAPFVPTAEAGVRRRRLAAALFVSSLLFASGPATADDRAARPLCADGFVVASGEPDPRLFSKAASHHVRAEWCEGYDEHGRVYRAGPYRERHANGRLRLEARYVDGELDGPILAFDADGFLFVRGELREGEWVGALALLLPSGVVWFDANYVDGRLDGPVLMRHPDGALAAETRYRAGREHGLARSFHPASAGGGLLSEVRVEDDRFVGTHRLFDEAGTVLAPLDPDHPLFATVPLPTPTPTPAVGTRAEPAATPVAAITSD